MPRSPSISPALSRTCARSRSMPVVVRQNWLKAYDYRRPTGRRYPQRLCPRERPVRKDRTRDRLGRGASVVRASDSSFQLRWLEKSFENGASQGTDRLTGVLSIVVTPPRTSRLCGRTRSASTSTASTGRAISTPELNNDVSIHVAAPPVSDCARSLCQHRQGAGDPTCRQCRPHGGDQEPEPPNGRSKSSNCRSRCRCPGN